METDTHIFFFGDKPNKIRSHIFSQWYPCEFTDYVDDELVTYTSAEQYMMAQKALLFDDYKVLEKILAETEQRKIKMLGRKVKNFDDKIWNEHKFDIVVNGNRLKFEQNPKLLKRLLKTEDKKIVEASPYDKIWGIGLSAKNAVEIPEKKWPGKNLLGKALMIVRDEYE